jgi:ferredoxin--NADP+ reductase
VVSAADFPPIGDDALLEPGMRKSVTHLRDFVALVAEPKEIAIEFDFFAMPVAVEGEGKVERIIVERTTLDDQLRSVGTGERYVIPCGLVVACIGYQTPPIEGVPYEHGRGRFANDEGRILPGLYCVGWARRGPSGTIGTNRPDGYLIADHIAADIGTGAGKQGRAGLDTLLSTRGTDVVTFRDWKKIEEAEVARARDGAPREKFIAVKDMMGARG